MDDLRPIWERLDRQNEQIIEINSWRQTTEYRMGQMETRLDHALRHNARAFGELSHSIKDVSKEVSEIHAEQMRQMGRMDVMRESTKATTDYKRFIWPAIFVFVGLLVTLGIIQGPN